MFLLICLAVVILAWLYILLLRPVLVRHMPVTFDKVNTAESTLWANSRTIFVSRLYLVGAVIITAHDTLAGLGFDWTPLVTEVADFLPEKYRPLALTLFMALTGIAFEWLRRQTSVPVAQIKEG